MSVLGKKLADYGASIPRRSCKVELQGETIVLYARPMTGMDVDKILRKHKDFAENPSTEAIADIIIAKAEDEDGDAAFDLEDKPILRRLPIELLTRIRSELFEDDEDWSEERLEDDEKN